MKNLLLIFSSIALGLLISCNNAPKGEKAATSAAKAVPTKVATKSYNVVPGSMVKWSGSKIAATHTGTLSVTSGNIDVSNGKVTGGKFMIDMSSLSVTDLEAGKGKEKLEGHLKSKDFFDVGSNPTSIFEITSITAGNVTGNLTMMGMTKSVTFPADVQVTDNGVSVATSDFTINRTDWGLKYGSASFFNDLKDKAINDNIGLSIRLRAT